ncbi:uncharacterized protein BJ212DRAFT_1298801 [Suillus subaureus]|uniref:Uncharacterized protein n=1 Tax=Suillus subaureus TaxID=48587 RepID=A0A9P7JF48_9AGAM|nr:uncharacterized protein BJ212DRAFT_1298801 [Suillus subaureus]KAG1818763.1 hypothetical protein BJ212DRAFT_1298801 [Suillus subaureus]
MTWLQHLGKLIGTDPYTLVHIVEPLVHNCPFLAILGEMYDRRLLFMLTTGSRVVTPGIKNPATDQLLLDGLLTGAMPDDHARKLKIAVKEIIPMYEGLARRGPLSEPSPDFPETDPGSGIKVLWVLSGVLATHLHSTSFLRRGSSGGNPRTAFDPRLRGKFTGGYQVTFTKSLGKTPTLRRSNSKDALNVPARMETLFDTTEAKHSEKRPLTDDVHQTSLFVHPAYVEMEVSNLARPRTSKPTGDAPQHVEQKAAKVEELQAMYIAFESSHSSRNETRSIRTMVVPINPAGDPGGENNCWHSVTLVMPSENSIGMSDEKMN